MGDMAEYYDEREPWMDAYDPDKEERDARDNIWIDINGKYKHISRMETRYIKNCMAMIKRKDEWRECYLKVFQEELDRRKKKACPAKKT